MHLKPLLLYTQEQDSSILLLQGIQMLYVFKVVWTFLVTGPADKGFSRWRSMTFCKCSSTIRNLLYFQLKKQLVYSDQVIFLVLNYKQKERPRLNTAKPIVS